MKGALGYYAFLMVFIVTFVAVAGIYHNGAFDGITGYVVDASMVPMIRNADTLKQEVAAYLPEPARPVALRRMLVVPKSNVDPAELFRLSELRHQFPNGFSADVRETDLAPLGALAELSPLPVYQLPEFSLLPTDGSSLIVLGGEITYPN